MHCKFVLILAIQNILGVFWAKKNDGLWTNQGHHKQLVDEKQAKSKDKGESRKTLAPTNLLLFPSLGPVRHLSTVTTQAHFARSSFHIAHVTLPTVRSPHFTLHTVPSPHFTLPTVPSPHFTLPTVPSPHFTCKFAALNANLVAPVGLRRSISEWPCHAMPCQACQL